MARTKGRYSGSGGAGMDRVRRDQQAYHAGSGPSMAPPPFRPTRSWVEGSSVPVTHTTSAPIPVQSSTSVAPHAPSGSPALKLRTFSGRSLLRPRVLVPAGVGLAGGGYLIHRHRSNRLVTEAHANGAPASSFASTARSRGRTTLAKSNNPERRARANQLRDSFYTKTRTAPTPEQQMHYRKLAWRANRVSNAWSDRSVEGRADTARNQNRLYLKERLSPAARERGLTRDDVARVLWPKMFAPPKEDAAAPAAPVARSVRRLSGRKIALGAGAAGVVGLGGYGAHRLAQRQARGRTTLAKAERPTGHLSWNVQSTPPRTRGEALHEYTMETARADMKRAIENAQKEMPERIRESRHKLDAELQRHERAARSGMRMNRRAKIVLGVGAGTAGAVGLSGYGAHRLAQRQARGRTTLSKSAPGAAAADRLIQPIMGRPRKRVLVPTAPVVKGVVGHANDLKVFRRTAKWSARNRPVGVTGFPISGRVHKADAPPSRKSKWKTTGSVAGGAALGFAPTLGLTVGHVRHRMKAELAEGTEVGARHLRSAERLYDVAHAAGRPALITGTLGGALYAKHKGYFGNRRAAVGKADYQGYLNRGVDTDSITTSVRSASRSQDVRVGRRLDTRRVAV